MTSSRLKYLGSVPSSITKPAHIQNIPSLGNAADFNVAAWLHLPGTSQQTVSLLLRYRDADNMQQVLVDRGKVNAHNKILLSGVARLPIKQKIEKLEVYVCGDSLPVNTQVEDLFVQAVEHHLHRQNRAYD